QLANTDMTNAFVPDLPGFATPAPAPGVSGVSPAPTQTTSGTTPGAMDLRLELSSDRVNPGETFTVTVRAATDVGVASIWWWATSTSDSDLRNTHTFDCNGATPCRNSWDESTNDTGTITFHALAADTKGVQATELTADLRVREPGATTTPTATTT